MTNAELQARVAELETLCRDVLTAGVELGLPQALLDRLWRVQTKGAVPRSFDIDVPYARVSGAPARERQPQGRTPLEPLAVRKTVLVVDDDPLMLALIKRIFKRENYELIFARDGGEALEKTAAFPGKIDLLVTDCEMPVLKGPELAEQMRARYRGLKILYQTGFSDILFDTQPALDDDSTFLEKPFTAAGLREAARLALFGTLNP